jgi:ApbE superfamily uncharacterized protein (UPF0280 family)
MNLTKSEISYKQTHLTILSPVCLKKKALDALIKNYGLLERYIQKDPLFLSSYEPVPVDKNAPAIVRSMADAAEKAGVGPMASVAGAFSDLIGNLFLQNGAEEVIVENGGDIFLRITRPRKIGVHAGPSKFSGRFGFEVLPGDTPLGVCTSSDSVGPSISLGKGDAVTVFASSAALADAAATAVGNEVTGPNALNKGIAKAKSIEGVRGVAIVKGAELGIWGRVPSLIKTPNPKE